jgi:hypothetical protein
MMTSRTPHQRLFQIASDISMKVAGRIVAESILEAGPERRSPPMPGDRQRTRRASPR